jgi:hypothetical protein
LTNEKDSDFELRQRKKIDKYIIKRPMISHKIKLSDPDETFIG